MEWSNSVSIELIGLYRQHECLWNPVDNDYKNKIKKLDAWNKISASMKCDVAEVKKKMESLLASFRRERQKQENTNKTGSATDEIFKSTWFAFNDMLFLMDKFIPKETKHTEELVSSHTDQEDPNNDSIDMQGISNEYEDGQGIESTEEKIPKRKACFKLPPKTKRMAANPRAEEAYKILKETVATNSLRDGSTIFGEHVALKHRNYSVHTRNVIEHLIGNILFNADMGHYEPHASSTPSISPSHDYQPNTNIIQRNYSFTPNSTPIHSPSPTESIIHNLQSPNSQHVYTPITSPSPTHSSFLSSQLLTTTRAGNSETSIRNYINHFSDDL